MDNNNFNNDPNYGESDNNDYSAPQQDYSAPQQDYSTPQQTYGQYASEETQNSQTNPYNAYSQYNDQQYNGQQYNGQQYNDQQYSGQQYNGQQYNGQQYNGQQYNPYNNGQYTNQYNNMYGNIGGVPVDEKGQPLKNRFGMKLTFSILEIISCNLISLIMGILGCVFTSKANSAYKEGRWEEFKSSAKTATVVLWVGLGGIILSLFMWIIMIVAAVQEIEPYEDEISDIMENNGDIDYDDLYDQLMQDSYGSGNSYNDDSYGDQYKVPDASELSDWYTFAINGEVYSVPNYPDSYTAAGLTWEDCYYTDKIAEDDYELYYLEDPVSGETIGLVWIANVGVGSCSPEDGIAFQVNIENESIYGGYKPNLVFGDGLTFDSSIEDIIAYYGEPDDESHYSDSSSSSDTYYWYMDDDYCGIEVDFYDGQFYEIYIEYYGD